MSQSSIHVRVLSFGPLKSVFGEGGSVRELPTGTTVRELLQRLRAESLIAEQMLCSAAVAVNQEYVKPPHVLADGDEVAVLPPVSGGSDDAVKLTREPIVIAEVVAAFAHSADGAMVTFDGVVRNNTRGRQTLHLDYEAYEEMAVNEMRKLRAEAMARFGVREVAIVHRLGRLVIGETSVLIVVFSAHRGPAFEASRFVIDTLKKTVPIWKREQFVDGAVWVDGEPFPEEIVESAQ
ncbi:molybdenum cofactor biosynthesis protein MoaE [Granulicella cerasi]|uniref:Molybdopterin synthase catalytic subunit n=1 Tax=Granulicella cerasi TaxID=741063 RepID=A0ABW1ZDD7_9BACT|nr:molybdenum cofactor biosynthesis protein MoaE [Granulicella cerasi]